MESFYAAKETVHNMKHQTVDRESTFVNGKWLTTKILVRSFMGWGCIAQLVRYLGRTHKALYNAQHHISKVWSCMTAILTFRRQRQ